MKKYLLVTLALMFATSAYLAPITVHAEAQSPQSIILQWDSFNEACRGGSGDNSATMKACERRNEVSKKLRAVGCHYHQGDYWKCNPPVDIECSGVVELLS